MTHAIRIGSLGASASHASRGLATSFWLGLLLLLLAGCAQTRGLPASTAAAVAAGAEPVTESDEPEARKRARIRVELASGYFEQGQTTVALDEIKLALGADPNYAPAYTLRGLVYARLNELRLAEDSFKRAQSLSPRDPDVLHHYGLFACQQGRYPQAIELFQQALASPVYGGQAKTLMVKGICQVRAAQFEEAEGSLARSYELDPGMFEGPLPRALNHRTTRVAAGLGMIPRVAASGEAIYRGRVPSETIEQRLETCWRPYHTTLSMLVERTYSTFGAALLIGLETVLTSWTEYWKFFLGPILIVIVLFSSGGLMSLFSGWSRKRE